MKYLILSEKQKEILLYLVSGILTTLCNIIAFYVFLNYLKIYYVWSNIFAWFVAVTCAYLMNRTLVFKSKQKGKRFLVEVLAFLSSRVFSVVVETLLLWILADQGKIKVNAAKIITTVVVIVINYVLSKLFVFRKKH